MTEIKKSLSDHNYLTNSDPLKEDKAVKINGISEENLTEQHEENIVGTKDESDAMTSVSGIESISSSEIERSITDSLEPKDKIIEDKGMETDNDADDDLNYDDENRNNKEGKIVTSTKGTEDVKGCEMNDDTIADDAKDGTKDFADLDKEGGKDDKVSGDEMKGNESKEKKVDEVESAQSSTKGNDENHAENDLEKELDTSTGESEFKQFLSQTPHELEGLGESDKGIMINDNDIIKAEDVFGRGKRARTPKTDNIYTLDYDPDYDPKDEMKSSRSGRGGGQIKQKSNDTPMKDTPIKKSRFPNLDIAALELPGEHGWKREIVVRNTCDDQKRRMADVYYKPPTGKKLRSMVEVSAHLKRNGIKDLTENNFSFIKTPISKAPFESVRNAGKPFLKGTTRKKPEIMIEKDSDEPAVPFNGTAEAGTQSLVSKSPRGRKRKHSVGRPPKCTGLIKNLKDGEPKENEKKSEEDLPVPEMQLQIKTEPIDPDYNDKEAEKEASFPECPPTLEETRASPSMSPPKKKAKATARKSTTQKSFKPAVTSPIGGNTKLDPLCNLNCPGLYGQPPTLQCNVCLCMFHPKCVSLGPNIESFICLRCISKACTSGSDGLMNVPPPATLDTVTASTKATSSSRYVPLNTFLASAISSTTKSAVSIATVAPSTSVSTSSTGSTKIKKEPVDFSENHLSGSGASSNVIGNVRNFLERKATDINQNQSSDQYPLLKEGLQKPVSSALMYMPTISSTFGNPAPKLIPANQLFGNPQTAGQFTALPGAAVRPVVHIPSFKPNETTVTDFNRPAPTPKLSISSPVSLQPPKLIAAPGTNMSSVPDLNGVKPNDSCTNKQGQLLTLPPVVIKRLNLNQPVSLKINNTQVTVPPSSFLHTQQGLKLFLPKNTFPVNTGETAKLSVTVTNDKTLSLDTDSSEQSQAQCGNLPTIVPNSSRTITETPTDTPKRTRRQYKSDINPANCFIKCLYGGFDCMMLIFEYLNVRDLFRVASVCKTWRRLAMHPCLWRKVQFRNMKILDWEKAAKYLSRRAVEVLNLQGLCHYEERNKSWHQLISVIHLFTCVHTIHFGTVPGSVLQALCEKMSQLEVLHAEWISDFTDEQMSTTPTKIDIGKFSSLTNLKVLKLRGVGGLTLPAFSFSGGLSELRTLKHLQKLSLTTLKELGSDPELEFLTSLSDLTHLELGDCKSWTSQTYSIIGKLSQLQSLRLECGGNSYDTGLAETVVNLRELENLELIEFLVPKDLHKELEQLKKLKTLKVWPDTSEQLAAQVNSFTLQTVTHLKTLQKLEWGILTNKNSSIILDGEDSSKQTKEDNQEWIPFLPASDNGYDALSESLTEYISLSNFKEKLAQLLPSTKIHVFSSQTVYRDETES